MPATCPPRGGVCNTPPHLRALSAALEALDDLAAEASPYNLGRALDAARRWYDARRELDCPVIVWAATPEPGASRAAPLYRGVTLALDPPARPRPLPRDHETPTPTRAHEPRCELCNDGVPVEVLPGLALDAFGLDMLRTWGSVEREAFVITAPPALPSDLLTRSTLASVAAAVDDLADTSPEVVFLDDDGGAVVVWGAPACARLFVRADGAAHVADETTPDADGNPSRSDVTTAGEAIEVVARALRNAERARRAAAQATALPPPR